MDSFQALGLDENALHFKVEVTYPNKETSTFEVLTRHTVDKVKSLAIAQANISELTAADYLLGVNEHEKLDIEFAKFIVSHPKIKEALESDELVKVGLFKRGVGSPAMPREKIALNADVDIAALRSNLETVIMSPKSSRDKDKSSKDKDTKEKDSKEKDGKDGKEKSNSKLQIQRRNSFNQSLESPKQTERKSYLWFGKTKDTTEQQDTSTHSRHLASNTGSLKFTKPRLSSSFIIESPTKSPTLKSRNSLTEPETPTHTSLPEIPQVLPPTLAITPPPQPPISDIVQAKGYVLEECYPGVTIDTSTLYITDPVKSQPWYNDFFYGKDHFNYLGNDGPTDTVIVSVIKDDTPDTQSSYEQVKDKDKSTATAFRVIIRTKKGDEKKCAVVKTSGLFSNKKKPPIKDIIQSVYPTLAGKKLSSIKVTSICAELKKFEDRQLIRNYKFGVLYCAAGQTDEEQMFSNQKGSADWEEFLGVLGTRVELQGWPNYRAGLDVKTGTTGSHSVHTRYKDYEVMFHVSTLLPYDAMNPQQLERKRHLGNDIVVIIFKEGDQQYDPNCIKSEFNHIFVVVSRVTRPTNSKVYYRVNIACKEGVPHFFPDLPDPPLIPKDMFREYLLCKLINGENTSYEAPAFKMKIQRTRLALLKEIASNIK